MPADPEARAAARSRVAAMRARLARIRRRVAALSVALFIAVFGALYVQLASGNDPGLATSDAQTLASTSGSSTSDTSDGSSDASSSSAVATHQS